MTITGFSYIKEKIISFCRSVTAPLPTPPPTLPPTHFIIQMGGTSSQPPTIFSNSITHGVDQSSSANDRLASSTQTSTSTTYIFNPPIHEKQLIIHYPFQVSKYYDELRTMSFTVLVGLFGVNYERVNGCLVPATLFKSNPILFNVFVVLIFLTFSASVVGKRLRGRHEWINKYLFPLAFSSLMVSLYIYMWDLLPGHLKWIPYTLLVITFLVLLTLLICEYKKKYIQDESNSNVNASSIATALVVDTIIQDESNSNANASSIALVADT